MNKYLAALSAVACLALSARAEAQVAQDTRVGNWLETRFHRVHLLNGNFIDGQLVSDSPKLLVMIVITGNAAWTLASIALLFSGAVSPNLLGEIVVVAQLETGEEI